MSYRYDNNPTVFIQFATDRDFALNDQDELMIIKRKDWGIPDEKIVIGELTGSLIDSMIENLKRMKTFAKKH